MVRRRLTIKRLDPWSVLKFGAVANVVLFIIFMLVAAVVWFIVDRLQLIDQACEIATDVGLAECGLDGGNLFTALALLGGMWVIVQTAVLVFLAFLHNLIADLTGGLVIGTVEDGPAARQAQAGARPVQTTRPAEHRSEPASPAGPGARSDAPRSRGSAPAGRSREPEPSPTAEASPTAQTSSSVQASSTGQPARPSQPARPVERTDERTGSGHGGARDDTRPQPTQGQPARADRRDPSELFGER